MAQTKLLILKTNPSLAKQLPLITLNDFSGLSDSVSSGPDETAVAEAGGAGAGNSVDLVAVCCSV